MSSDSPASSEYSDAEDSSQRPRFFDDDLESSRVSVKQDLENKDSFLFQNDTKPLVQQADVVPIESPPSEKTDFVERLKVVVPEMSEAIAQKLCLQFQDTAPGLSGALSYYFDNIKELTGSDSDVIVPPNHAQLPSSPAVSTPIGKRNHIQMMADQPNRSATPTPKKRKGLSQDYDWKRFIGTLQVPAMATRPTSRPLQYGMLLALKKHEPGSHSGSSSAQRRKRNTTATLVRVMESNRDRELGRVSEDIAEILYSLLNRSDIVFEAVMIFCNEKRLSIGDTFYIQIDCFLTSKAFERNGTSPRFMSSSNSSSKYNFGQTIKETDDESRQKQKAIAIVKLFDKLKIKQIDDESSIIKSFRDGKIEEIETISIDDDIPEEAKNAKEVEPMQTQDDPINLNALKQFYKSTQSFKSLVSLPETVPPADAFKLELRPYQKQGLSWLLKREENLISSEDNEFNRPINPLWKQFKWPTDSSWKALKLSEKIIPNSEDELFFFANLHSGEFSLKKPLLDNTMRGGILSDEMGLGKTISILALVLSRPRDTSKTYRAESQDGGDDLKILNHKPYAPKTTLIVVPMSLLNQWCSEFEKANNSDMFSCEVYYGGNVSSIKTLLTRTSNPPTVVVTTYGIVQNEWSKLTQNGADLSKVIDGRSSGLFSIRFFRIVIDEGHIIRNRNNVTSKAVMQLEAKCSWILTGTPIINRLDDLYGLIKFLRLEPWCQIGYWKSFISEPFERRDFASSLDVVNAILEPILLRRTKQMKDADGKMLIELPPKEVVIEKILIRDTQKEVYDMLLNKAEEYVRSSLARGELLKKYSTILVHILRLRQVCCHLDLLGTTDENENDISQLAAESIPMSLDSILRNHRNANKTVDAEHISEVNERFHSRFSDIDSIKSLECSICTSEFLSADRVIVTECLHSFCEECLREFIDFQKGKNSDIKCPNCREDISETKLYKVHSYENRHDYELVAYNASLKPAKVTALIRHLKLIQDKSAGEQVVVFSQFSRFLDILEKELSQSFPSEIVKIYKFDGRLNLKERTSILNDFQIKDFTKQKILLLSLKAGGVGLNLTCASNAFLMDPWWSPSMEDQAIDRIHRIGQVADVKVTRFIIENSIEEKMLKIQETKRTLGEAIEAGEDERKTKRIEEIKSLFA